MNFGQFETNMLTRAGWLARLHPTSAKRLLACALDAWPNGEPQGLSNDQAFRDGLRQATWQRYRAEYGFSPLALMLLGAIINFLVNWYFSDPQACEPLIQNLKHTRQTTILLGGDHAND